MTSFGRQDTFNSVGMDTWEGGAGRFHRLTFDGLNTATLRLPGGTKLQFHTEILGSVVVGHLTKVISPNGNEIQFFYETSSQEPNLLRRKLLRVLESYGRAIDFHYTDLDYPEGISRISDFSGREVHYDYNALGQLLSVRSPTVTNTGGLNDFPAGKTKLYQYLGHPSPQLQHALTSIVYPNQTAAGLHSRMAWTYEADPASPFFGFVRTHTLGNPRAPGALAAGGTYTYSYQTLGGSTTNQPAIETTVVDRKGTTTIVLSNASGHMLQEDVHAIDRTVQNGGGQVTYRRQFRYNAEGDLIESIEPLGGMTVRSHNIPANAPRNSMANETSSVRMPDSRGGQPTQLREDITYEPIYNKPFRRTDARGNTTTYILDYMEDLPSAVARFAPELGISTAALQSLLSAAGVPSLNSDVNGDGRRDQYCGNVIRIDHPIVTLPAEASGVGLSTTQAAHEMMRYNAFGQLIAKVDPEGNVTSHEYYGADDPDGNGVVDVPGASSSTGGYLRRITADTTSSPDGTAVKTQRQFNNASNTSIPRNTAEPFRRT